MNLMHLKKEWDCKLEHLKIVTNGQQYTQTTENEKDLFWINACTPIKKQWMTEIPHLFQK